MLGSGGQVLSDPMRAFFEPRFGYDFSGVRLHTDTRAQDAADELNARAFTTGTDIALGDGDFAPGTQTGRRLIAHELAHVVQQGRTAGPKTGNIQRQHKVPPKNQKLLDKIKNKPANYHELFLWILFDSNHGQAYIDYLQWKQYFYGDHISELGALKEAEQQAVVAKIVEEIGKVINNYESRKFVRQFQKQSKLAEKVVKKLQSMDRKELEYYLVDAMLLPSDQLWTAGLHLAMSKLKKRLGKKIFESFAPMTIYRYIGTILKDNADALYNNNADFKKKVDEERKRRQKKPDPKPLKQNYPTDDSAERPA